MLYSTNQTPLRVINRVYYYYYYCKVCEWEILVEIKEDVTGVFIRGDFGKNQYRISYIKWVGWVNG